MRTNEETTSTDIATVDNKVGLDRRKKFKDLKDEDCKTNEGYIHDDIIRDSIDIRFFNKHRSDDSFKECFDIETLTSMVHDAYARRAFNSDSKTGLEIFDMNVTREDSTIDELVYALNVACNHDHVWIFRGFAQHGTQIIFGIKNDRVRDKTVVIYQHFPKL